MFSTSQLVILISLSIRFDLSAAVCSKSFEKCSDKCQCTVDQMKKWSVRCPQNLQGPPNPDIVFPFNTVVIDLDGYELETINRNFFRNCSNVISLDMSITGFVNFTEDAFDDLVNLKSLRNIPNDLVLKKPNVLTRLLLKETLTDKSFKLVNLYSESKYFPWNGRDTSLQKFMEYFEQLPTSLEKINTFVIHDDRFALAFVRFKNLSNLRIAGELPMITNITFKPLVILPIKILRIFLRGLERIELNAFQWFPNLRELHVNGTILVGMNVVDILHPVFVGLSNSRLEKLYLNSLVDRRQQLTLVSLTPIHQIFPNDKSFQNLTHLFLNETNLYDGDFWYYFSMMPNLRVLSLQKNFLSPRIISKIGSSIEWLKHLEYIDVSNQQTTSWNSNKSSLLDEKTYIVNFIESPNLEILDISGLCGASPLSPIITCGSIHVEASPNLKQIISKNTFAAINIFIPDVDIVLNLDLSNEKINLDFSLPRVLMIYIENGYHRVPLGMMVSYDTNIRYVKCQLKLYKFTENLRSYYLSNDEQMFMNFIEIGVDISKNHISLFNNKMLNSYKTIPFMDSKFVNVLNLSENALGSQLKEGSDPDLFSTFYNLQELDLSSNIITYLSKELFRQQIKMKQLKLNTNFLQLIEFQISHMHDLQTLDLSHNLISQMSSALQNEIDGLKSKSPNFTINLKGNPIQCSCDTFQFLQWLHDRHRTKNMFQDFDQYSCVYSERIYTFENVAEILDKLHFQCLQDLIIKVTASMASFLIFLAALSFVLYRHRWDIRFFCIKFVAKRNAYHELEESSTAYEYDAFLAYHKDDREWVINELNKNLGVPENDIEENSTAKFKFCIHERDFMPGNPIEDNIVNAIENSRKTILVLSNNFLTSEWCEFELRMARMESVKKRTNTLIAVMLEPLSAGNMSPVLLRVIRRNTYIEWSENPREKERFWEKMRTALKPSAGEVCECDCGRVLARSDNHPPRNHVNTEEVSLIQFD